MGILEEQCVTLVGGGGDIGRAVAGLFAREGARVLIVDPGCSLDGSKDERARVDQAATAIRQAGGTVAICYECVTSQASAVRAVQACVEQFGRLDALVHCAGVALDQSLGKIDEESLERLMATHVSGTLFSTQAAAAQMKRQKTPGKVVNTTSLAGLVGNYGQLGYAAASSAVLGITRTASIELQRFDISVNAVAPIAKTRQTAHLPMFEHVDSMTPEHAAPAYLFLASSLSGDLTGNVLAVAGAKLSVVGLAESGGQFKEDANGVWSASEIAEHWEPLSKI